MSNTKHMTYLRYLLLVLKSINYMFKKGLKGLSDIFAYNGTIIAFIVLMYSSSILSTELTVLHIFN